MASTKREPIRGSEGRATNGVQGQRLFSPRIFTTLNMGSERSRVGVRAALWPPPVATYATADEMQ
jgi:hypothetical protein